MMLEIINQLSKISVCKTFQGIKFQGVLSAQERPSRQKDYWGCHGRNTGSDSICVKKALIERIPDGQASHTSHQSVDLENIKSNRCECKANEMNQSRAPPSGPQT